MRLKWKERRKDGRKKGGVEGGNEERKESGFATYPAPAPSAALDRHPLGSRFP